MENFAEIFERDRGKCNPEPGTLIEGTIVEVRKGVVVVNAGLKSEAIVPREQFEGDELESGGKLEFFLDAVEDGHGKTRLSRKKARWLEVWKELEDIHANNKIIEGRLINKIKGGFSVKVKGMTAFLPGSLIDLRSMPESDEKLDMDFKIVKLDQSRSNIVLSHRAVVQAQTSAEREEQIKNLKKGTVVKGTVKTVTSYGAFLSVGGIDGLLHVCHMAWRHVHDPSEIVSPGDEIEVMVLDYEAEKNRLSLGLKQLSGDPWERIERRYPKNTTVFGHATNITDYGCFVEIEEGIEGLVHMSEMDWIERNVNPGKIISVGQEVEVMVIDVDPERRRLSLSMKQCRPNPWKEFMEKYKKGDIIEGTVKSFTDFGMFVRTKDIGVDGLVYLSDMSWTEPGEKEVSKYEKGQEIKTMVLDMDAERERISLGIKQISEDPIALYLNEHPKGSVMKLKVDAVEDDNAVFKLSDDVRGLLSTEDMPDDAPAFEVGKEIEAMIVGYDKKKCGLILSVKAMLAEEEQRVIKEYTGGKEARTTLGDFFKGKSRS